MVVPSFPNWLRGNELGFLQLQDFLPSASLARDKLFHLGLNLIQDKFSLDLIIVLLALLNNLQWVLRFVHLEGDFGVLNCCVELKLATEDGQSKSRDWQCRKEHEMKQ